MPTEVAIKQPTTTVLIRLKSLNITFTSALVIAPRDINYLNSLTPSLAMQHTKPLNLPAGYSQHPKSGVIDRSLRQASNSERPASRSVRGEPSYVSKYGFGISTTATLFLREHIRHGLKRFLSIDPA